MVANVTSIEQRDRIKERLAGTLVGGENFEVAGLGEVTVDDGRATIRVQLPVPPGATRTRLEREIEEVTLAVDGVTTVEVAWELAIADAGLRVDFLPDVKHVIAVASGKGGVGKSTVATNIAVTLAEGGADVGLFDADVYGPNTPAMLGIGERTPGTTLDDRIRPWEAHGVKVMSMGFLTGEDDPVIWRGSLVDDSLKQLLDDVQWGELDYLIVDLPPGTGDAHLTLTQTLPLSGAVIVTTPQPVAAHDAERGLRAFERYQVPVLGIVENMSSFECPDCGSDHEIFSSGGAQELSERFDVPVLGRLPLDPIVGDMDRNNEDDSPGIEIPLIGRITLPRTRKERDSEHHAEPVALREEEEEFGEAFGLIGARTAARVDHFVSDTDSDAT